jgi:hypothetical protein
MGEWHGQEQSRIEKTEKRKGQNHRSSTEPKGRDGRLATELRIRQEKIAATAQPTRDSLAMIGKAAN